MKQNRVPQLVLALIFAGLLSVPFLVRKRAASSVVPVVAGKPGLALERYGFQLEEASAKAGLHFTHTAPTLDPKLAHIMPQVAAMGAGVSVVDFDGDGWLDLYVTNSGEGSKNALYHNNHDGTFTDVADSLGIADVNQNGTGVSMGAVWGDYDNDGFPDLLLYKWGKPELFHNDGGKHFTRVTDGTGAFPAWCNANSAIWLDYDGDGKLDCLICGYFDEKLDLWHLKDTLMMPDSFEYARNGGRKYLLHNLGGGKFEDVTEKMGLTSRRWTLAALAVDLHGSGYPDIVLANDYGVTELYENQVGKHFREEGKPCGLAEQPKSGMNACAGDVLNSGKLAVYVSNITEEGVLTQGNNLWVPKETPKGAMPQFANLAGDMGVELGGWSFGGQFGDLNNDGTLDLYLTNGYVSLDKNQNYWYDYSKIAGGSNLIINDARNWPAMRGRSLSGYQQKCVWVNDGAGKFTDVAQAVGVRDTADGRAVAFGDFQNRGVLDVVVANQRGPLLLYRNTVAPTNQWVDFALTGTKSNRDAIGAQVRLFWNGQQQMQEINGGSGFAAQSQKRVHFGLGKTPHIEKVTIRWPSGTEQTLTAAQIKLGTINPIVEP